MKTKSRITIEVEPEVKQFYKMEALQNNQTLTEYIQGNLPEYTPKPHTLEDLDQETQDQIRIMEQGTWEEKEDQTENIHQSLGDFFSTQREWLK